MAIAVDWDIKHQTKPNQNNGDPDQMPRSLVSNLGMRCKPMSHKKDAMLIWIYTVR